MDNNNQVSLKRVISFKILKEIKRIIEERYKEKIMPKPEVDEKMIEEISSIDGTLTEIFEDKKTMMMLLQYYIALYNDNLDLLIPMINMDLKFSDNYLDDYLKIFLGLLRKDFSSCFDKDYYLKIIGKYFWEMEYIVCRKDENGYYEKCANLIKNKPDILNHIHYKCFDIITSFSDEVLIKATNFQFARICDDYYSYCYKLKQEQIDRLSNLILNNNYQLKSGFKSVFEAFNYYTDEELLDIENNYNHVLETLRLYNQTITNTEFVKKILYSKMDVLEEIINETIDNYEKNKNEEIIEEKTKEKKKSLFKNNKHN